METIRDILNLFDMAVLDIIDYGKDDSRTKLINSNLVAIGAESWTIENQDHLIRIDFTLSYHHQQCHCIKEYAV